MIYVMNHDKRDEFTFCIIASLMRYKHQLPTAVPVAQQCDALFRDLTALWAWCWVPAAAPSPAETLSCCLTRFSAPLKSALGSVPWQLSPLPAPGLSSQARFLPGTVQLPSSLSLFLMRCRKMFFS